MTDASAHQPPPPAAAELIPGLAAPTSPSAAPAAPSAAPTEPPTGSVSPPPASGPVTPPPPTGPPASVGGRLADGEWHRLHPASPLLKGGVALLVIIGVVIANMREKILGVFLPGYSYSDDPIDYVLDNGYVGWAVIGIIVFLLLLIVGFYASWRMHTFRITNEVVEVRSGILYRTNRKARLDRIQGINIVRPLFPRLFGAAKLEISQAGQDANVQLSYLVSAASDDLRREILRLASGTHETSETVQAPAAASAAGESVIGRRMSEFLAPELDPNAVPPKSIVNLNIGRLIGSLILSSTTVVLLILVAALVFFVVKTGEILILFAIIPGAIAFGSFYVTRITRSLRYSIAGTPDGIRVGFGLLSTSNETLPPGRIHSVQVSQTLLWRGPGWWEIKVNRASHSTTKGAGGQQNTTILPVGDRHDVCKVLELILPELLAPVMPGDEGRSAVRALEFGLESKGGADDAFTVSPPRARVLRWFSRRRNGFAITPDSLVLRKGAIWRQLIIVPQPRLQSVALHQGPLLRMMRLASVQLHTVSGPIIAAIGALDADDAEHFFEDVARVAVDSAQADTSHRWRASELPA